MRQRTACLIMALALSLAVGGCGDSPKSGGNQNTGNPLNSSQNNTGSNQGGGAGQSGGSQSGSSASGGGQSVPQASPGTDKALKIDIVNAQMTKIGTAELKPQSDGVSISFNVTGLTPGKHGVHFHQNGRCEGPDFKSAGDHFNPDKKKHGLENAEGPHAGDMPNIEADKDGKVTATITAPKATLSPGKANSLVDDGGRALVIHAQPDDGKTDPSGNSGDRIACGVVKSN